MHYLQKAFLFSLLIGLFLAGPIRYAAQAADTDPATGTAHQIFLPLVVGQSQSSSAVLGEPDAAAQPLPQANGVDAAALAGTPYNFAGEMVNPNLTIPAGWYGNLTGNGSFGWQTGTSSKDVATNGFAFMLNSGDGNDLKYSGVIDGAGSVSLRSAPYYSPCCVQKPLILLGTRPNQYTGVTILLQGVVQLAKSPGVTAIPSDLVMNNQGANDELQWAASNQIADKANLTINSTAGKLNLNGYQETIQDLRMVNGSVINTGAGNTGKLIVAHFWYNNAPIAAGTYTASNLAYLKGGGSLVVLGGPTPTNTPVATSTPVKTATPVPTVTRPPATATPIPPTATPTPTPIPTGTSGWPNRVFAPYVDVTLGSTFTLAQLANTPGQKYYTLAFIVSGNGCAATWGGIYPLSQNFMLTDITNLRKAGGNVIISFGGAAGSELGLTCTTVATLQAQYQAVIDKYSVNHIDLDIEGNAITNAASVTRRNQALAALQTAATNAGKTLKISYTLPVMPSGLDNDGLNVLRSAIAYGVNVETVNIMTMDYGSGTPGNQMGANAIQAATNVFGQLQKLYPTKTTAQLWHMIGVTPMIGVNDVTTEIFTLSDAQTLLNFAQQQNLSLLAMWSVARDQSCPGGGLSDTCSGLAQSAWGFTNVFKPFTQ
ncbi:MAG: chitinase [Caldilineaceae bacterium]